jgi:hypothetical protein
MFESTYIELFDLYDISIKFNLPFTVRAGFEELLLIISCPFIVIIPLTSDDNPYEIIEDKELTPYCGCVATVERP